MRVIKIGAVWCPACLVMRKVWKAIMHDYNLDITELDYDMDLDKVKEYNVGKVLPVVIFFDDNNIEIERIVGEIKEDKLKDIIDRLVKR